MGSAELKEAFQGVAGDRYTCTRATLRYSRDVRDGNVVESQILNFSGMGADGVGFSVDSEPVPAGADIMEAVRVTAQRLLDKQEPWS